MRDNQTTGGGHFAKKSVLRNFAKFTGKQKTSVPESVKLQALGKIHRKIYKIHIP